MLCLWIKKMAVTLWIFPCWTLGGRHSNRLNFRADRSREESSGVNMECPRGETHSPKRRPRSSDNILSDVLLSGWPVYVSDHTLHHPLYALVYSIPGQKQMRRSLGSHFQLFLTTCIWGNGPSPLPPLFFNSRASSLSLVWFVMCCVGNFFRIHLLLLHHQLANRQANAHLQQLTHIWAEAQGQRLLATLHLFDFVFLLV